MSNSSSKSRISALEKLKQSNAAKLELETKKMEERIRSLKEKMVKEKEERERLGGSRWTSGRTGPLTKTTKKSPDSKKNHLNGNKVPRKIKVLTDEPIDHYRRKVPAVAVDMTEVNLCGQCENTVSLWYCHECSEKYCDACFSQFHLKGALKKHTKTKIETEVSEKGEDQPKSPSTWRQDNSILRSHGATTNSHPVGNDLVNGPSLLNGSYNEEESANSFAQALQEWRDQNKASKTSPRNPPICTDTSCGTTNELITDRNDKKELRIKFNSSISYGDRLFLKKNRENNLASQKLAGKVIESENNKERKGKNKEINNGRSDEEYGEKEKNELSSPFALDYRKMIQNATTAKSDRNFPSLSQENMSSHCAVSVKEILPVELSNEEDQGGTCIIEECDKGESSQIRPTSRHGAVTICEMYTSGDSEDFQKATSALNTQNYVSPSITSKPFFLKPSGRAKKHSVRTMSAERKKTPRRDEQRTIQINKEKQRLKVSSKKNKHGKESAVHQVMNGLSPNSIQNTSSKQLPLKKEDVYQRPRPLSKNNTSKETRIPIRQAWKPKHTHKELSSFFLAGVDRESDELQQYEEEHNERSSSIPITNLGRGSLSFTWNPVQSYTQLNEEEHNERSSSIPITNLGRGSLSFTWNPVQSYTQLKTPDSMDISSEEKSLSIPEEHYLTSVSSEERHLGRGSNNSDDLQLACQKFQELKDLPRSVGSKDNNRNNKEDELLELTVLDDFGTGDQDDDDLATLNDLAWELASSTGRLTRCDEDLPLDSDDDSIEDKDGGSGLTSPCTLERSFRESIMDDFEEMERKIMEQDL